MSEKKNKKNKHKQKISETLGSKDEEANGLRYGTCNSHNDTGIK